MPTWLYATVMILFAVVAAPAVATLLFVAALKVWRAPRPLTRQRLAVIAVVFLVEQSLLSLPLGPPREPRPSLAAFRQSR
jgi:hypothetical protein